MPNRNQMNRFSMAPTNIDIGRSVFNRDHSVKFSFNVGDIVPFYVDEVLPGDTFSVDTTKVVRVQPLVTPIMDNLYLDTYYFFVPNRLVWSHWVNFMGETESAWLPSVEYSVPKLEIPEGGFSAGTIADYMGIPINTGAGQKINALPFRAYALICNDWFRDQNLMDSLNIPVDDSDVVGVNTNDQVTDVVLGGKPFIASKYHDYFTSALPAPQRGPAVTVGVASQLPVVATSDNVFSYLENVGSGYDVAPLNLYTYNPDGAPSAPGSARLISTGADGKVIARSTTSDSAAGSMTPANLWVNTDAGLGFTINEMRSAFAVQKYYEKLARSGSRYIESIKAFFGVTSPDARMQRPEYLGGNRVPLNIAQVENVTNTSTNIEPIGSVAGMSITGDSNSDFTKSFTEHGYVIGVTVCRINHTYQQGLERHWLRDTIFDYYNPVFANIGEQPINSKELYLEDYDSVNLSDNSYTFGYQEAWADYRYKPSRVAGEMRSAYSTSLDIWHLADYYTEDPHLSADWIREDKSLLDRALAVTSSVSNQLIADFYIQAHSSRPMPLYSIPGLIDHH